MAVCNAADCYYPHIRSTVQENKTIRRPFRAPPPTNDGPRANRDIRALKVQLIDEDGENQGLVSTEDAIARAEGVGLDLVEMTTNGDTAVCKIVDLGKLKYQSQKKASEKRKKQKTVEVKEIKMRPNIDVHDYDVKMRNMRRFFNSGDKVKVTLRFRGREMAHQNLGMDVLMKVKAETEEFAKVESYPKMEGRQMTMVLGPLATMVGKIDVKGEPETEVEIDDGPDEAEE